MGAKAIVVLVAIWTIVQGFIYGILSILALLATNCQLSMRQYKVSYLMYIIYFRDQKCGPVNWNIVADIPPPYEPVWPAAVTMVAFRTNILAIVYLVLSSIWIVTSLMLIAGCFVTCLGRASYYLLTLPWVLLCIVTAILDVVAVAFFFYDLFNTLNMDSFVALLQLRRTSSIYQSMVINANILPLPAVIMMAVASRGFIFWCLNLLCIPVVLSQAKIIVFGKNRKPEANTHQPDATQERNQSTNNNVLENHFPATTERSRYSDPSHYHQYQYDNMSYQQDKYDLSRTIGRRYVEPLKDNSIDEPDTVHRPKSRMSSSEERSSKKSSWSDDSQNSASTLHLTHSNAPKRRKSPVSESLQQHSWRELSADAELKIERPHFRLPNKPSLLKKLSDSSYVLPDDSNNPHTPHNPHSPPYAGDVLRSQMPWSYFQPQTDPTHHSAITSAMIKPKKSFNELRDDEDTPPVPVPDYTVHDAQNRRSSQPKISSKKPRPAKKFINPQRGAQNNGHDNDGRWSGPEYRY